MVESVFNDIFPAALGAGGPERSGCSKSTVARSIMQLDKPQSGLIGMMEPARRVCGSAHGFVREAQMIFQDPFSSLSRMTSRTRPELIPCGVHRAG